MALLYVVTIMLFLLLFREELLGGLPAAAEPVLQWSALLLVLSVTLPYAQFRL